MKDETYSFISDVKEKKVTARSARHMRTHCGKGGRVRLPSDNLSKKELQKMNGECKSYKLNSPMTWNEFMSMPDDIKVTYIKLIREKFNTPDKNIAEMFGVCKDHVYRTFKKLGLQRNVRTSHPKWDKEGFFAWWHGVDRLPTPVIEEVTPEDISEIEQDVKNLHITAEPYVEDDLPFEELKPVPIDPIEKCIELNDENTALNARIDELLKVNEELMAVHEKDKAEIAWLRNENDSLQNALRMREAQMEVVQLIFGGKNNG